MTRTINYAKQFRHNKSVFDRIGASKLTNKIVKYICSKLPYTVVDKKYKMSQFTEYYSIDEDIDVSFIKIFGIRTNVIHSETKNAFAIGNRDVFLTYWLFGERFDEKKEWLIAITESKLNRMTL